MANGGWYGTAQEWERLEASLIEIDPTLEAFSVTHNLALSKNHKNTPERSIKWGNGIQNLIQIYLANSETPTYNMWLCASEDRGTERYWKKAFLFQDKIISKTGINMPTLLENAFSKITNWNRNPEKFEFATKLAKL